MPEFWCYVFAVIILYAHRFTALKVHTEYEREDISSTSVAGRRSSADRSWRFVGAFTITKQIISNKNFLVFVTMNFLQVS